MNKTFSKKELLSFIKNYNNTNDLKILNCDKVKKKELYSICIKYNLLNQAQSHNEKIKINLNNIPKTHLIENIGIHFLKQNISVPNEILKMKKKDLVNYIEQHNITHYTPRDLQNEIINIENENNITNTILYNILLYDNLDYKNIEKTNKYIACNNLDTNIEFLNEYTDFIGELYESYEKFCIKINKIEKCNNNLKTFPKFISILQNLTKTQ